MVFLIGAGLCKFESRTGAKLTVLRGSIVEGAGRVRGELKRA